MRYRIGDKLICKNDYKHPHFMLKLEKGKIYEITAIVEEEDKNIDENTLDFTHGYYRIGKSYDLFYSKYDEETMKKRMEYSLKYREPGKCYHGQRGRSPSFVIEDFFESITEQRRNKLKKLKEL